MQDFFDFSYFEEFGQCKIELTILFNKDSKFPILLCILDSICVTSSMNEHYNNCSSLSLGH